MPTFTVRDTLDLPGVRVAVSLSTGDALLLCDGGKAFRYYPESGSIRQLHLTGNTWSMQTVYSAAEHLPTHSVFVATLPNIYCTQLADGSTTLLGDSPGLRNCPNRNALNTAGFNDIKLLAAGRQGHQLLVSGVFHGVNCVDLVTGSMSQMVGRGAHMPDRRPEHAISGLAIGQDGSVFALDIRTKRVLRFRQSQPSMHWDQLQPIGSAAHGVMERAADTDEYSSAGLHNRPMFITLDQQCNMLIVCWNTSQPLWYLSHDSQQAEPVSLVDTIGRPVECIDSVGQACILASGHAVVPIWQPKKVFVLDTHGAFAVKRASPRLSATSVLTGGHMTGTLPECMWNMQQRGRLCDVSFTVGNQIIKAHKVVLASASEYFDRMFSDDWQQPDPAEAIQVPQATVPGFTCVLKYMYTRDLDVPNNLLTEVAVVARMLLLPALVQACIIKVRELMWSLDPRSAVRLCVWAHTHMVDEIRPAAVWKVKCVWQQLRDEDKALLNDHPELLAKFAAFLTHHEGSNNQLG